MMLFKIDENLPAEIAENLRSAGHDAMTVVEQGMKGFADPTVISVCNSEGRILVTLDTDFMDIRRYPPSLYPGIIVLRPRRQLTVWFLSLMERALVLLSTGESVVGKLWIVDEIRIRIRSELPDNEVVQEPSP